MVLSNISVPLVSMVDAGVLGHLDDATPLAGVALAGAVFGIVFMSMNFLRMGTTGLTAQALGRQDFSAARTNLGQALIVSTSLALVLLAFKRPIASLAWSIMAAEPDVIAAADTYFRIRMWSAPTTLANFALIGWFIGMQNTRIPLVMVLVSNTVNIVLDLWLVGVVGLEEAGVAIASVSAEGTGMLVGLAGIRVALRGREGHLQTDLLMKAGAYRDFFNVNGHLFVRTLALDATFAFFTAQGARFGEIILAVNALLMNLQLLLSFALDGLANAAEALVGKAWGARDRTLLKAAVSRTLGWSVAIAVGFALAFAVGGRSLVALLSDIGAVRTAAAIFLPWLVLSPLVSVWSFLYDGVFVGATWARDMRNIMLISAIGVFLPAWWLTQGFDNHGLWLSFTLFMIARGAGMALVYRRRLREAPIIKWPATESEQYRP
ncbi:MAG: MATE family efflux transporter [Pseudomonadota bacterium]